MKNLKRKYFVYVTTNNKQYVGDHSTNNLNDKYLGSGTLLTRAIKKYGKEKFKRKILELFETKQEAFNAQEKYIKIYNTLTPNGYNISPKGGLGFLDCHSEETKKQIGLSVSKKLKGRIFTEEHKRNLSKCAKLRGFTGNPMYGKKHTEESKLKNRISNLGKKAWNKNKKFSDETRKKMSDAAKGREPWNKGKKGSQIPWNKGIKNCFSDETKKMSETAKERKTN